MSLALRRLWIAVVFAMVFVPVALLQAQPAAPEKAPAFLPIGDMKNAHNLRCIVKRDADRDFKIMIRGTIGDGGTPLVVKDSDGTVALSTTLPAGKHEAFEAKVPKDGKSREYVIFVLTRDGKESLAGPLTDLPHFSTGVYKNHRARSARTKAETPALLKGLIRCGHCQTSMGITFTRKAGRMYRYYLCQNASKGGYGACPVKSVAAGDIERVVVDRLRGVLRDPEIVARIGRTAESPIRADEIRDALRNIDELWGDLFPGEQARIVELLVQGVVVEEGSIAVTFRANGLRSLALESQGKEGAPLVDPGDPITIRIPMQFKRRGGRKEIIVPESDAPEVEIVAAPQEPLVLALAQAHHWQEMLDAGRYETVEALAKRMKVSTTYAARILRLNFLAPDIVQAILDGREPSGLSLTLLGRALPAAWEQQRERLGFPPAAVSA